MGEQKIVISGVWDCWTPQEKQRIIRELNALLEKYKCEEGST